MAQDVIDDPYETMFRVLEAAVEAAFPEATVERDSVTVLHPDGTSDRVEVGCYQERVMEGRRVVGLSFRFPERIRAAVEREISVGDAEAGGRGSRLGLVTLNDDGTAGEARVAFLGPGGPPATCQRLTLSETPVGMVYGGLLDRWGKREGPVADVEITTLHEFRGGLASAAWVGAFDLEENRYRLLVPVTVSLENGLLEVFFMQRPVEAGVIELLGRVTGETFRYECPETDGCLIPAEEVLTWLAGLPGDTGG